MLRMHAGDLASTVAWGVTRLRRSSDAMPNRLSSVAHTHLRRVFQMYVRACVRARPQLRSLPLKKVHVADGRLPIADYKLRRAAPAICRW